MFVVRFAATMRPFLAMCSPASRSSASETASSQPALHGAYGPAVQWGARRGRRFQRRCSAQALTAWGSLLTALLLTGQTTVAQTFDRYPPKEPAPLEAPAEPTQPSTLQQAATSAADTFAEAETVEEALRGIVVLQDQTQVVEAGRPTDQGIAVEGIDPMMVPDLEARLRPFLGKRLTYPLLETINAEILSFFRDAGQPVVDAILPQQEVAGGVVQILVLQGKLGDVIVEGARFFDPERIANTVSVGPGETIDEDAIERDLAWLNRNPFRRVSLNLQPGAAFGTTDIVLKTQDRFPLRIFAGYEDTGTDLTGQDRYLAGFNVGNAFGLEHQFNYQLTVSNDFEKLEAHSGTYIVPLPWRHQLSIIGSYSTSSSDALPGVTLDGESWQVSGRYEMPLPKFWETHRHSLTLGADFKRTNNNLEFGGALVQATETDVVQLVAQYNEFLGDPWGSTSFTTTVAYSPGNITDFNDAESYQATRTDADPDYAYARFRLSRVTRLPLDLTWTARAEAQFASAELLSSEQLGVGGFASVRGYEERAANGDAGHAFGTELLLPPVRLLSRTNILEKPDSLQVLGFVDYGSVYYEGDSPDGDPHKDLSSMGVGIRYAIAPTLSLRFSYGWQLNDDPLIDDDDGRSHLGIVASF